jgi:hypothetical protein
MDAIHIVYSLLQKQASHQDTKNKRLTIYSNTKYNSSFSLMTSFSFTIFGWFNLRSDCSDNEHMLGQFTQDNPCKVVSPRPKNSAAILISGLLENLH